AVSEPPVARPAQREFALAPRAYPDPKLVHQVASATPRWTSRPKRETEEWRNGRPRPVCSAARSYHLRAVIFCEALLVPLYANYPPPSKSVCRTPPDQRRGPRRDQALWRRVDRAADLARPRGNCSRQPSGRLSGSLAATPRRPRTLPPPRRPRGTG